MLLLLSCLFFPTLWTLHPFEFLSFFAQKRWSISSKDRGWLLVAEVVESYLECWTNTTFKCDVNKIGQVLDKSVLPTLANSEPKLWDFGYQKMAPIWIGIKDFFKQKLQWFFLSNQSMCLNRQSWQHLMKIKEGNAAQKTITTTKSEERPWPLFSPFFYGK